MQVRLLSYTTVAAALLCAAFPGWMQAQCSSPCQTFTSASGLNYPQNTSQNNVAWASVTVPTSTNAPGFPSGTTISHITVTLTNWNDPQSYGEDRQFVLQAPSGQTFEFAGHVTGDNGGNTSSTSYTYTLDDSATNGPLPNTGFEGAPPTSGTYKPNVYTGDGSQLSQVCEDFPSSPTFIPSTGVPTYNAANNQNCAQQTSKATLGSVFNGLAADGTWTVWMYTEPDDPGATVQGISVSITPALAASTVTTVSATANEVFAGSPITFTATVKSGGNNVSEGTVTFQDGNNTISGCGSVTVSGGTAQCMTTLSGEGNHTITATYNGDSNYNTSNGQITVFVDNQTVQNGSTFCNNGTITLNEAGNGGTHPGSPYPQHVFVSDLTGTVTGVTLTLQNVNAVLEPLQLLLTGPTGGQFVALARTGNYLNNFVGNLVLSDSGGALVPQGSNPTAGGTYLPTDYDSAASFPAPAPSGPYKTPATVGSDTFATAFTGQPVDDPNNDKWSLYVSFTQGVGDTETIGGYCLTFTTNNLPSTTTSVQSSPQMEATTGTSVTFTATVKSGGNPVNAQGTVKFEENGTVLSGPTTINSSGQATYTTASLSEGIHNIEAIYSGAPGAFNGSSGTVTIEIDTPTTNPNTNQYCNPGPGGNANALSIGTSVNSAGEPASPYPSRINVTNEAGTVKAVSIALNGFTHNDPIETLMMLEGPTGTNIVFWDDAGGTTAVTSPLNITFSDSASGQLGVNTTPTSTSYQPTANNDNIAFAFPSTTIANQPPSPTYASSIGSQTLTSAFQNINPNNYWSLFWFNRPGDYPATIGSWCLNFTENPPVVTLAKVHNGTFTQGDSMDTYTITVANPSGPGSTGGTMTLTDTLPTGMSAVSIAQTGGGTGSDWTCTTTPTLGCTRTTPMGPGETDTITLTVSVSYNTSTASNAAVNNVSLSGGGISGAPVTAQDTQTVKVGPGYALNLSVNPSGGGTAMANPTNSAGLTAGHYVPGATVTLNAMPTQTSTIGYTFNNWSGSVDLSSTTANPTTIQMNSATENVTANFTIMYQQVSGVSVTSNGFFYNKIKKQGTATYTLTNGSQTTSGPIQLVLSGLPGGVTAANNTGTFNGNPYWTATAGSLGPGASVQVTVTLNYNSGTNFNATSTVYSGTL